jgi:hydrogenase maturation protein HypF
MTSGNMAGSPIIRDNDEAFSRLSQVADYFLIHDRDIIISNDDSVLRCQGDHQTILRRSRSFVPAGVSLSFDAGTTLAFGAMLKNTVCLTRGKEAFLSHHIGDLENLETIQYQAYSIDHFVRSLRIHPDLIVHDLHPDYPSSRAAQAYAESNNVHRVAVQHHHAHAVSCMAEHGLQGPVLALSLDGTGWGEDETVWGGELLLAELHRYQRLASLLPIPMPGGDRVIQEPWRMALGWLHAAYGEDLPSLGLVRECSDHVPVILQMIDKGLNSPLTSSCGRLFDATAALLGLCRQASFEGQAAVQVEIAADLSEEQSYGLLPMMTGAGCSHIDSRPLVRAIVDDVHNGVAVPRIAARFHNSLTHSFADACKSYSLKTGVTQVVLSGGVLHNLFLLQKTVSCLDRLGLSAYTHRTIPAGDGGISLGQAVAGRAMLTSGK